MNKKYLLKNSDKTGKTARLFAKAVDLFLCLLLSIFFYPVGILLAVFYLSVSDALQSGQSVGKKLMGFNVISIDDGQYCTIKQSLIRNLPLSLPLFFAVIPIWGWIIWILAGSFFIVMELYLLLKLDSGNRLGDVMADTTVNAINGPDKEKAPASSWFIKQERG
jgi:uncharacterized RDD family membrane protein YckC